jgi:hypothetical protein
VEGAHFVKGEAGRKLVDQSFCFAGHFANEDRKKEFIGFVRFDARALLLQLPI